MRRLSGAAASGCITVYLVGAPRPPCAWFVDQRRFAAGKCPFSVLGLPKSASKAQVKAQYKQLAKEHHPDAGGCESKFREVKDAYEKCNSTIDENVIFDKADRGHTAKSSTASSTAEAHDYQAYANDHKSTSTSEEDFAAWKERKERQQQRYSYEAEGSHPWEDAYKSDPDNPFSDKERRRKLCDLFESATTPEEVDTILSHCLASRIFDQIDIGEPLLRALNRFHCVGLPLGEGHVQRCMQAVDKWEQWHGKKAPQSYYHPLMVVYSDPSATHHYPALDICQGVSTLLECVEAKGFAPDDWMMSLASKVFRTSPLPDW